MKLPSLTALRGPDAVPLRQILLIVAKELTRLASDLKTVIGKQTPYYAQMTGTTSVPNGQETPLLGGAAGDEYGMVVSNKFVAPVDGVYLWTAKAFANGVGGSRFLLGVKVNGAGVGGGWGNGTTGPAGKTAYVGAAQSVKLDAGGTVQSAVYQDSGAAQSVGCTSQLVLVRAA